jgi:hypothetical protein
MNHFELDEHLSNFLHSLAAIPFGVTLAVIAIRLIVHVA